MRWQTLALFLIFPLAACKAYDPTRVEADFGQSVRRMIDEQVYSPAEMLSADNGPNRLDGATAVRTVEGYDETGKKARARTSAGNDVSGIVE